MAESMGDDRTEKATPRRREQARNKGQVARSQEVNSLVVLAVGGLACLASLGWMGRSLSRLATLFFGGLGSIRLETSRDGVVLLETLLRGTAEALAPLALVAFVAGTAVATAQVGIRISAEALIPEWNRLNPVDGLKRLVGKQALFELAKNLVKVTVLGLVAWLTVQHLIPRALDLARAATRWGLGPEVRSLVIILLLRMLGVLLVLAIVDWVWQRHRYEEEIKMTKQDVKREARDTEGDPQIKARLRSIQLEMARRRMMDDVKKADLVITNPTHVAVALRYKREEPAPRVVAKGLGAVAERIREVAREAQVPIVEKPTLARALYKACKLGEFIPTRLFEAVAEVLAAVLRAGRRGSQAGEGVG